MKVRSLVLLVLTLVCLGMPSVSAAQNRQGFWFGVGGGYGSAGIDCDGCESADREGSGVFYLKGGWTLNPRVLLGGEFNFWTKEFQVESDVNGSLNMYNFSATVTFYPQPKGGFFVKGGAGAAVTDMDLKVSGSGMTVDLGTGFGFIVGAGYDIPVGRKIAITPAINYWYGRPGDLKVMGETVLTNFRQNVFEFSIGIVFP
jgi:hypothetical protein